MQVAVAALGVVIALLGLFGLVAPERLRTAFRGSASENRFRTEVALRLALGIILWIAADELRFPLVMRALAVFSIAAALGVLMMGRARLDRLVEWWLVRPDGLFRLSFFLVVVFGAFLIYVTV